MSADRGFEANDVQMLLARIDDIRPDELVNGSDGQGGRVRRAASPSRTIVSPSRNC